MKRRARATADFLPCAASCSSPARAPSCSPRRWPGRRTAISLDLEDAVEESRKAEARERGRGVPARRGGRRRGKIIIVRVNGLATPHFDADLEAVAGPLSISSTCPWSRAPEQCARPPHALARLEAERGIGRADRYPRQHRDAARRCACRRDRRGRSARRRAAARLRRPVRASGHRPPRRRRGEQVQLSLRLAAGEAGDLRLRLGLRGVDRRRGLPAEAEAARRLGYHRQELHPSEPGAIANAVFRPSEPRSPGRCASSRRRGGRARRRRRLSGRRPDGRRAILAPRAGNGRAGAAARPAPATDGGRRTMTLAPARLRARRARARSPACACSTFRGCSPATC